LGVRDERHAANFSRTPAAGVVGGLSVLVMAEEK
jgi:hypothetical protein